MVKLLPAQDDVNFNSSNILGHTAAMKRYKTVVKLLQNNLNVNPKTSMATQLSLWQHSAGKIVVKLLLA